MPTAEIRNAGERPGAAHNRATAIGSERRYGLVCHSSQVRTGTPVTKAIAIGALGAASLAVAAVEGTPERMASSIDDADYGPSHSEGTKR